MVDVQEQQAQQDTANEERRHRKERRPTVSVQCGIPQGLQMRVHDMHRGDLGIQRAIPMEPITLQAGANPGIDKEFFDRWAKENHGAAYARLITATDEMQKDDEQPPVRTLETVQGEPGLTDEQNDHGEHARREEDEEDLEHESRDRPKEE